MKVLCTIFGLVVISSILSSCGHGQETEEQSIPDKDLRYVPMNEFKYKPAVMKPGTEVEVFANLRGKEDRGDTVYYYQFIVIDKKTKDTVRILCPEITVQEGNGVNTQVSVSPLSYNINSGITTAFFEPIDTSQNLLLNGSNLQKLTANDGSVDINHLLDSRNSIKIVILHKNDNEAKLEKYKTAIGKLNFRKIPW